jgi:beta-1,2-mannobiose phosphorylase / 1,2-beta-oligomannan phosphorylase
MRKHPDNPLITPAMVTPSHHDLVVKGALNPAAVQCGDEILLLLRVAEGCPTTAGEIAVPVYTFPGGVGTLDVLRFDEHDPALRLLDTRGVLHHDRQYVSTVSHLRLARSRDGVHFSIDEHPFLVPHDRSEEYGVEDARIVKIDDSYYVSYTAVSRDSYGTSLLRTDDWVTIDHLGMIFSVPNKDVCIFPEKIGGRYLALHRPYNHGFGKSSIWLAESPDLLHWGHHRCILRPAPTKWEQEKIGGGAPPIKTERGWLTIYHGKTMLDGRDFYSLQVLLLDLADPSTVLYRSKEPLLVPQEPYETEGFVPNVVFLNGMVLIDQTELLLYYSACDETTCLARCLLDELVPA